MLGLNRSACGPCAPRVLPTYLHTLVCWLPTKVVCDCMRHACDMRMQLRREWTVFIIISLNNAHQRAMRQ